jgi:flagellin-like protein
MNTLKKMKKNAKALSPVVASIILIAVTVAVSIAVAAWMGALVVGQMDTEQIQMGTPTFAADSVSISIKNAGTSPLVISAVYLNGEDVTSDLNTPLPTAMPYSLNENAAYTFNFTATITTGNNYEIKVVTAKNNPFVTTAIAPTT